MCIRDRDEAVNKVQITKEPISDESLPVKTAYRPLKTIAVSYTHLDVYKRQGKDC